MLNKVRRQRGVNIYGYFRDCCFICFSNFSTFIRSLKNIALSIFVLFFSYCPIVSFYPKALRAIGLLKSGNTLTPKDRVFSSFSKTIRAEYIQEAGIFLGNERKLREVSFFPYHEFDNIKFRKDENNTANPYHPYGFALQFFVGQSQEPKSTIYTDYNFSRIVTALNNEIRGRIAILIYFIAVLFAIISVLHFCIS